MRKITYLFVLSCLLFSCRNSNNINGDLKDIKKVEIIKCYTLQDIFKGFLKFNDIVKKDSSRLKLLKNTNENFFHTANIDNQQKKYPLFSYFELYGFLLGDSMMYIKSSFLGVIANHKRNIWLHQLSDTSIRAGFPYNINFFFIPSPFIDTMSVLIGSKTKEYARDISLENFSGFGFQQINSYDSDKKKQIKLQDDTKSFIPYIVFKETAKNMFSQGEYLIKLTLKDTVLYKSLDRDDLKNDTIFFEYLLTRKYINDKVIEK